MSVGSTPSRAHSWGALVLSWFLLTSLSSLWSLATPLGAAPDEPAHLIRAASVVRGQVIVDPSQPVLVPRYIADTAAQTCFAFESDVTADCGDELTGDPLQLVEAPTSAIRYNPLYYAAVGWPSLLAADSSGVYWMRFVSGAISSLFLALSLTLVLRWRAPTLPLIGFATAIAPMVLFLNGTVNPNSIEVTGTLAAFLAILSVVREGYTGRIAPYAAVAFAAGSVAANMRGLSLLWLAIALLAPFVVSTWGRIRELARSRSVQLAAGGIVAAALFSVIWTLGTNSLGAAIEAPSPVTNAPGVGTPGYLGFAWTLFSTFEYAQGMIGIFGWLDTPAPPFVFFVWSTLVGGLLVIAISVLRGRVQAFVLTLSALTLLLPPILQGIYITEGGVIWQGRYILPVFVCLAVAVGWALSTRIRLDSRTGGALLALVLALWAIAQFQSLAVGLRRYSVGLDEGWQEMLFSPQWQPPGGIPLLLGSFGVLLTIGIVLAWRLARSERAASSVE